MFWGLTLAIGFGLGASLLIHRVLLPGADWTVLALLDDDPAKQGLRIDYILLSSGLLPRATSCEVMLDLPPKWSDHAPVVLDIHGTISHIIGAYGSYASAKGGCEASKMTLNYGEQRTVQAVEVKG